MPADRPLVQAAGISKSYGRTVALNDAGIVINAGRTHALVGRNGAGKSTLVSILTGLQAPDTGTVEFDGEPAPALADRDAWRSRVACVYQKSTIIPELTVAENLFLNRHARGRRGLISWSTLRREATELLQTWSVDVDATRTAAELTVEQRQLVEIARALSFEARFIILDEPTAQLDSPAINRLFERMRQLQAQGVTFLYISHHLEEIYRVCDEVTVFRDARHITTGEVAKLAPPAVVAAMTGDAKELITREVRAPLPAATRSVLSVRDLEIGAAEGNFAGAGDGADPVSFEVRAGEAVGLAGGGGSGKREIAEAIAGLRRPVRGTISIDGTALPPGSVPAALAAGIGLVPQDRHAEGFVPGLSIAENITMTVPGRIGSHGLISAGRRDALARRLITDLVVKTSSPALPVSALSGGNQQKVVMGRAIANDPRVLVLIQPTAGVDVRSKETLLGVVDDVRERGAAVVVASDELDDLRTCDRVLVMFQGHVVGEFANGWSDSDLIAAMEGIAAHE